MPPVAPSVSDLARSPELRGCLDWFRQERAWINEQHLKLCRIPAPTFLEKERAEWFAERFRSLGWEAKLDRAGNVCAWLAGRKDAASIAVTAHLDTVLAPRVPDDIKIATDGRLLGPGVSDNGAGVTAMLAMVAALRALGIRHALPLLFIGNVGEEGEGDLRGMRHIFSQARWKDEIHYSLVLDGAGADTIVAEALGSRRFEVIVRGPGGHSWSDFGAPNPIVVLSRAVQAFAQTPVPASPKTTFNVGVIRGGTSVNSIPESASMRVDIRSTSMAEMERLERALRQALDQAVEEETQATEMRTASRRRPFGLSCEVVVIGNRPAGELYPNARILQVIRAVDAQLGNAAQVQRASTDANIPLSLGLEAIAIGGGGAGGGAHTLQEWFDCNGRELGLKRILLTLLGLAGVAL